MIGIIDYGMGNLRSIYKAIEHLGYSVKILTHPSELAQMNRIILPGVGAFPQAMLNLQNAGFTESIVEAIEQGKPFLGICLGMQLLFSESEEIQLSAGLGVLNGRVKRLEGEVKIPHMGWNRLLYQDNHPLWRGLPEETYVYFVHSFALAEKIPEVIATTYYGKEISVAVASNNLMGVQFHPEKSGEDGLQILKNFGEMVV